MKLYSTAAGASITMGSDGGLRTALVDHFRRARASVRIFETGTYEGRGSSTLLAEAVVDAAIPCEFITAEIDWQSWRKARRNLRRFPFVRTVWGSSLRHQEALRFLGQDEVLRNHARIPDVYIDDVHAPYDFYLNELRGSLSGHTFWRLGRRARLLYLADRIFRYKGEDLLARTLRRWRDSSPLAVLDSAGGVGWLEFQTLLSAVGNHPFAVLLDDVHHLKHFRSREFIHRSPAFEILHESKAHGTLFARFHPPSSPSAAHDTARTPPPEPPAPPEA